MLEFKNRIGKADQITLFPFSQGLVDLRVFQVTKNISYPTHIKKGKGLRDKADNEERKCLEKMCKTKDKLEIENESKQRTTNKENIARACSVAQ